MSIRDYNQEPDDNTSISGINIAEGCPPGTINNAIRQMMADIAVAAVQYDTDTTENSDRIDALDERISDRLDVLEAMNFVPKGMISMWSGSIGDIPEGWALCNGENGTPDLQDRFIVGAGNAYDAHAKGGSRSAGETTLTIAQMPSHQHAGYCTGYDPFGKGDYQAYGTKYGNTSSAGGGGSHSHPIEPPYYALCLIMKL